MPLARNQFSHYINVDLTSHDAGGEGKGREGNASEWWLTLFLLGAIGS